MFTQSWFPICLSGELSTESVIGRDFLDGRVVVARDENGCSRVFSAYCAHAGADLATGDVVNGRLRCAFHHWEYDANGRCVRTGAGDPPPPTACLFSFPTVERYGIVWAFNGLEPLFEIPDFPYPDDRLLMQSELTTTFRSDPWVFAANTSDMQHIKVVHGIQFLTEDPHDAVRWGQYSMMYNLKGRHQNGELIDWEVGIFGSNVFIQYGNIDGSWFGALVPMGLPRPGNNQVFVTCAVLKGDGSENARRDAARRLEQGFQMIRRTALEDKSILDSIHYTQGAFTKADRSLAKFLQYIRDFPRAHPAASYMR